MKFCFLPPPAPPAQPELNKHALSSRLGLCWEGKGARLRPAPARAGISVPSSPAPASLHSPPFPAPHPPGPAPEAHLQPQRSLPTSGLRCWASEMQPHRLGAQEEAALEASLDGPGCPKRPRLKWWGAKASLGGTCPLMSPPTEVCVCVCVCVCVSTSYRLICVKCSK